MKIIRLAIIILMMLGTSLLGACGPAAATAEPAAAAPVGAAGPGPKALVEVPAQPAAEAPPPVAEAPAVFQTGPDTTTSNLQYGDQKIIKNAEIRLLVANTNLAIDGLTQTVGDVRGYIISTRVWSEDHFGTAYKYGVITIGVPVDQFENALRRLRVLALKILEEQATGEDVTDQFVDLQSQLANLEATRDRVRGFLDQARNVDEALKINQQLSQIEAEIEHTKGRMNYIQNRAAFSTITVYLDPELPEFVPTATPTRTPTPVPSLQPWEPGQTASQAANTLVSASRIIGDVVIWLAIVFLPLVGVPILIVWLAARYWRRRSGTEKKR